MYRPLTDTGTDDPVVTLEESQGTGNESQSAVPYSAPATGIQTFDDGSTIQTFDDGSTLATGTDGSTSATNAVEPMAQNQAGAGAPSEDAGLPSISLTSATINSSSPTNTGITPRANILDQFASYTYALSWYMLTPDQATALSAMSIIDVSGWSLIMQSGGASQTQQANTAIPGFGGANGFSLSGSAGRNKYFTLDYYMDNLIIESAFNNIAMSTVNEMSFTVTEPNGITLLQNLGHAAMDLYKDSKVSAKDAFYVMAIRFYGYDINGKLSNINGGSASGSAITKYFPFNISNIEFKAANRAVEYQVKGVPRNDIIGKSSALGSIPTNCQLVGETVDDILNGKKLSAKTAPTDQGRTNSTQPSSVAAPTTGIQPGAFIKPVQPGGGLNQDNADALNLLAAGQLGA